ncbi:glycine/D-amino acid oxidase-like deaminating enzyme/nitrite reductase/ring-hydroxylating ferredoxin subunit [Alkalibacillus flavidus]|uniref:Glycine/D-amino acid oxidase-like deaminating enzyme/nitrite reductase/ring-hydroxylating ferredoxin subunit n=1 Tax=Alkalibacillus flavidus TaxID=546021 RepID=A0ABV2KWU2_9BACI
MTPLSENRNHPIWTSSRTTKHFPSLERDETTDIAIVGAGITGITAAYLLQQAGKNVTLIDAHSFLTGTTLHTTGKVTAQHGLIYDQLLNDIGYQATDHYLKSNQEAINLIKTIIDKEHINCQWEQQDAYLFATSDKGRSQLEREYQAYDRLNIDSALTDSIPFQVDVTGALAMKDQYQFNPITYLSQLLLALDNGTTKLYENTPAIDIDASENNPVVTCQNGYHIKAQHVLICTHYPFHTGPTRFATKLHAERSYVLAFQDPNPYPGGMYLSIDQPTRSIREATIDDQSYILFGGDGHKTGQGESTEKHYDNLKRDAYTYFSHQPITHHWSTQDLVTLDDLPYIGPIEKDEPSILLATGYRKWGMTNGTAAAKLLADYVLQRMSPHQQIFLPTRPATSQGVATFLKENTDTAKHLTKGKVSAESRELNQLKPGEATTFKQDGQRKGAYQSHDDTLYIVDTTCTHAGCEVNWNGAEKTWDCPCHGSRFSYTGEVIEGPAQENLHREKFTMGQALRKNKGDS